MKNQIKINVIVNIISMWTCEIDNVQALLIRYQQMLQKMMNILVYNSHNIINSQGLQKIKNKFQNTMEGIFVQIASIFIILLYIFM